MTINNMGNADKLNDNLKKIGERIKSSVGRKVDTNFADDVAQNGLIKAWQHLSKIDNQDLTDKDVNFIAKTHSNRVVADFYSKRSKELEQVDLDTVANQGKNSNDDLSLLEFRLALKQAVDEGNLRGHYKKIAAIIIDNPTVSPVEIMKDLAKSEMFDKSAVTRFKQKLADII